MDLPAFFEIGAQNASASASKVDSKVIEFWDDYALTHDSDATTHDELERLQSQATDCLYKNDIAGASATTVEAYAKTHGQVDEYRAAVAEGENV